VFIGNIQAGILFRDVDLNDRRAGHIIAQRDWLIEKHHLSI
jgi:hypothetical protein